MNKIKLNQNKQNAINKLIEKYKGTVFSIAYKYTKNRQISEDIAQETYKKIFLNINELRKENSVKSWITKIAENTAKDFLRGGEREKDGIHKKGQEIINDKAGQAEKEDPEKILEAKEYESLSEIEKLKSSSPQFLKELQRSLDYIHGVYLIKKEYELKKRDLMPFQKTKARLIKTKKSIEKIFGLPVEKEINKAYKNINRKLSEEEKEKMENLFNDQNLNYLYKFEGLKCHFLTAKNKKLREIKKKQGYIPEKKVFETPFPEEIENLFNQIVLHFDNKEFLNLSLKYLTELIEEMYKEISRRVSLNWNFFPSIITIDNIDKLRIEPPVLIFMVWTKAFRKNVKTDLKMIKALMLDFKEQYKDTLWEPLFDSLNEFNAETWRKKIHAHFKETPFYDELSSYIYKKSFIEKRPYFPHR